MLFVFSDKRLLHWSNIVGASHSKAYNIWQYGGYASKGIKEVCEFGYPRTLEQEMRQHVSVLSIRCLSISPFVYLTHILSIYLSIFLYLALSIHLFIYQSVCLSRLCLSTHTIHP